MIFSSLLVPDRVFRSFEEITPAFLKEKGIKHIISDIDNTLSPYEEPTPPERVIHWIGELQKEGIALSLVSNNHPDRVSLYAASLGVFTFPEAKKPFRKGILLAMKEIGSGEKDTCVLGDQLFTDILAGKRCGLRAYFVPPIKDRTDLFQKTKRLLEKPYLRQYERKNP